MSRLSKNDRKWLEEKFGDRANFSPTERLLYGHDIAAIPGLFKPGVGRTVPDVVVQPKSEEELSSLMRWAAGRRIPLVPRGKGTSGYGGVIPIRKGIVVDFYRMKDVFSVDAANETVTVEPGITWEQLDQKLAAHGLPRRLYPTALSLLHVYNVAAFLPRCLESLGTEPGGATEVILVDDGSTDECPRILAAWAEARPHARLIRQPNAGLSGARNAGLELARGRYLAFVVSDDYYDPGYYSRLAACARPRTSIWRSATPAITSKAVARTTRSMPTRPRPA